MATSLESSLEKKDNDMFNKLLGYVPCTLLGRYGLVVVRSLGADLAADLP